MINTIIFDFGDVFINLDKEATNRAFKEFSTNEFPESLHAKNREYETGFVTSDEISEHYQTEFPDLESEVFFQGWNSMLLDFPEYRLKFLQKLKEEKDFTLLLLSNTNDAHIEHVQKHVPFFEAFKACFDGFYLSHEMGLRKPDPQIFRLLIENHQLDPSECLFIDDTAENTESAASLGFHVWNIEPTREDVIDLFTAKKELF